MDDDRTRIPYRGAHLLNQPMYNKGSAFTRQERLAVGLEGLLPSAVNTLEQQGRRVYENIARKTDPLERYIGLIRRRTRRVRSRPAPRWSSRARRSRRSVVEAAAGERPLGARAAHPLAQEVARLPYARPITRYTSLKSKGLLMHGAPVRSTNSELSGLSVSPVRNTKRDRS